LRNGTSSKKAYSRELSSKGAVVLEVVLLDGIPCKLQEKKIKNEVLRKKNQTTYG